jgi:hypothetical protein
MDIRQIPTSETRVDTREEKIYEQFISIVKEDDDLFSGTSKIENFISGLSSEQFIYLLKKEDHFGYTALYHSLGKCRICATIFLLQKIEEYERQDDPTYTYTPYDLHGEVPFQFSLTILKDKDFQHELNRLLIPILEYGFYEILTGMRNYYSVTNKENPLVEPILFQFLMGWYNKHRDIVAVDKTDNDANLLFIETLQVIKKSVDDATFNRVIKTKNQYGHTVLQMANKNGLFKAAQWLIEHGADSSFDAYHEPILTTFSHWEIDAKEIELFTLKQFSHNSTSLGEAMTLVTLPNGIPEIVLDYLDGEINSYWQGEQETKKFSVVERQEFKLFSRTYKNLINSEAALVAKRVLRGDEKSINEALDLIRKKPDLLHYHTQATDPQGRIVQGTIIAIAAMAGDLDCIPGITSEENRGAVERLALAGGLSKEEVIDQLQVITSKESQVINEQRNQRILGFIKQFGYGVLLKYKLNEYFYRDGGRSSGEKNEVLRAACKQEIDDLKNNLSREAKKIITAGYIFDPKLLQYMAEWFECRTGIYFGDNSWNAEKNILIEDGFMRLEDALSFRDKQFLLLDNRRSLDSEKIIPRTLSPEFSYRGGADTYLTYLAFTKIGGRAKAKRNRTCFVPGEHSWDVYVKVKQEHCQNTYGLPARNLNLRMG